MAHYKHVEKVEQDVYGRMEFRPGIEPGDTVDFGAWRITITQNGLDCDCGKGVFCPYNPQVKR